MKCDARRRMYVQRYGCKLGGQEGYRCLKSVVESTPILKEGSVVHTAHVQGLAAKTK